MVTRLIPVSVAALLLCAAAACKKDNAKPSPSALNDAAGGAKPLPPADAGKETVKAFEAAKPVREANPEEPDYNAKYYVKKLDENLKKVKGFLTGAVEAGAAEAE